MAFTISNEAAVTFAPQSAIDSTDIDVLVGALSRTGVVSGCAVTAQGTPDMTVAVAAGTVLVAGAAVAVVAVASLAIGAAGAADRKDIVVVSNAGAVSVVAGTAGDSVNGVTPGNGRDPMKLAIPASSVLLASVYVSANTTVVNAVRLTDKRAIIPANAGIAMFGDGSDGAVVISSNTTLTRDMHYTDLTINSATTLTVGGYKIHCTGTLTNNGTISASGNNATSASGATAAVAGTVPGSLIGANGTTTNGANGGNQSNTFSGAGGAGGAAGAFTGGLGGTATVPAASADTSRSWFTSASALLTGTSSNRLNGGASGGGGAGDGTNSGGGSGSGGGVILINASIVVNNGTIRSNGGNGFTPTAGVCGGGGGGGGGTILINTLSYTNTGTVQTLAGSKGSGVGGGSNGVDGSAGTIRAKVWT